MVSCRNALRSSRLCLVLAVIGALISIVKFYISTGEDEGYRPLHVIRFNTTNASSFWQTCSVQQLSEKWKPIRDVCLATNLVYIKIPKTASSTAGGVMRRIASRYGVWGVELDFHEVKRADFEPILKANHWQAHAVIKRNRFELRNTRTLLVTFVREPIERALSEYYHFKVSREGFSTSASAVAAFLRQLSGSFMSNYIDLGQNTFDKPSTLDWHYEMFLRLAYKRNAQMILNDYTFVGITERMPESLIVLKHIMGLPSLCDVLYFPAKISAGLGKDRMGFTHVRHVPLKEQPLKVRQLVAKQRFMAKMSPDVQLYKKANETLDKWIAYFGSDVINEDLWPFTKLLSEVKSRCSSLNETCYWNDNGCHYPCIDQICKGTEAI